MSKQRHVAAVYAAGHFFVDFCCASLMLRLLPSPFWFVVYNFCAFALQMPIGLLADILKRNTQFSVAGILLLLLAALPLPVSARVLLLGLGNACYHVGGGRNCLLKDQKMLRLGIFVSPGALGITFSSLLKTVLLAFYGGLACSALCGLYLAFSGQKEPASGKAGRFRPALAGLMLAVVLLRSFVGICMETPWKIGLWVIFAGVASALGKTLGGLAADRFGGKRTGVASLLLSAGLFCLPNAAVAGILGLLVFNITMPITLRKASNALPGLEGFAFGLLTFGLFLGYLPGALGLVLPWWTGAGLCVISAVFMGLERHHD